MEKLYIEEHCKKENVKVLAKLFSIMEMYMKELTKMIYLKAKALCIIKKVRVKKDMRGNSSKEESKDSAYIKN